MKDDNFVETKAALGLLNGSYTLCNR